MFLLKKNLVYALNFIHLFLELLRILTKKQFTIYHLSFSCSSNPYGPYQSPPLEPMQVSMRFRSTNVEKWTADRNCLADVWLVPFAGDHLVLMFVGPQVTRTCHRLGLRHITRCFGHPMYVAAYRIITKLMGLWVIVFFFYFGDWHDFFLIFSGKVIIVFYFAQSSNSNYIGIERPIIGKRLETRTNNGRIPKWI